MYKKILVPLDGSKLAECALTDTQEMAKCCDSEEVILVRITEKIRLPVDTGQTIFQQRGYSPYPSSTYRFFGVSPKEYPEYRRLTPRQLKPNYFGKKENQAQRYLDRIKERLEAKGIKVSTAVLIGKPAEEITNYAAYHKCDLIIIASHGRSGISRWTHGSVADRVFRSSCVPILMIRAPGCVPGIAS